MTYGLNLACSYKGFDIAIDFAGAALQSFQRNWETKWPFQAGNTFNYMVEDRWHHEDPLDPSTPWVSGNYPALRPQSVNAWHVYCNNSTYWLTNAAYFRMKNLEIGYTIPQKITQKIAMQKLKPEYQNAIYLADIEELSYKEISQIMKKPESSIKVLIHRARKNLKEILKKEAEKYER